MLLPWPLAIHQRHDPVAPITFLDSFTRVGREDPRIQIIESMEENLLGHPKQSLITRERVLLFTVSFRRDFMMKGFEEDLPMKGSR